MTISTTARLAAAPTHDRTALERQVQAARAAAVGDAVAGLVAAMLRPLRAPLGERAWTGHARGA